MRAHAQQANARLWLHTHKYSMVISLLIPPNAHLTIVHLLNIEMPHVAKLTVLLLIKNHSKQCWTRKSNLEPKPAQGDSTAATFQHCLNSSGSTVSYITVPTMPTLTTSCKYHIWCWPKILMILVVITVTRLSPRSYSVSTHTYLQDVHRQPRAKGGLSLLMFPWTSAGS